MNGDAEPANAVSAGMGETGLLPDVRPRTIPRAERSGPGGVAPPTAGTEADREPETDRSLLQRIAAGEERAMQFLFDRYADHVYALAHSILQEHADAEDISADVFLQAWRTAHTFDPARGSVVAWLAVITRSRSLDRLRSRRQRGRTLQRASEPLRQGRGDIVTPVAEAPDRNLEALEARRLVERALSDLPEAQRSVIELAYFSGLSQSEIAARLSVPLGTVKTRTLHALTKLRKLLGPLLREGVA